jgi:hypothetical protein
MDSQKEQFLNAEEVEANPAILCRPDARQKRRNRSGQAAGISKEHISGPFAPRLIEMMNSPAYRVLSLAAHRILSRLEIEFERHGRKPEENGNLPCTYDHFVEYGVHRLAIAPAIRELVALGFIQVTRKGSAGNAEYRQPTLFMLTYRPFGSHKYVGNGWRRIGDMEEAEAVATAARSRSADARARDFGRKGGLATQAKKQNSSYGKRTDVSSESELKQYGKRTEMRPENCQVVSTESEPPLEFPGGGSSRRSPRDKTTPPAVPFAWTLPLADMFPPQSPNDPYAGLLLCLRAPTAAEIASPRMPQPRHSHPLTRNHTR